MSVVAAAFGPVRRQPEPLHAMRSMGDRVESWAGDDAWLAVARFDWELEPGFSGAVHIARDDDLVLAADAALFHRADLGAALDTAGITPLENTPSHWILAAYRAWGDACLDHLEGDFAFVLWDGGRQRALLARDYTGKRPLHYAVIRDGLLVASTVGGVRAHPDCPGELDLAVVGGVAAGQMFAAGPQTCFQAIQVLPPAHRAVWRRGLRAPERFWSPPFGRSHDSEETAAADLRDRLRTATNERMLPGINAVWMSGGWDSTAVFASAASTVAGTPDRAVRPVSIHYPENDPGHEDPLIRSVASRWNVPIHWLDIEDIPLFAPGAERARDEPFAHLYENWNRALAAGARATGARVALDGNGGDQVFQNTDIFLADLVQQRQWRRLLREWRSRPREDGLRDLFAAAIQPNLSPRVVSLLGRLRGRRLRHYLERRIPGWVRPEFVARQAFLDREQSYLERPAGLSHAEAEIAWMIGNPMVARAFAHLHGFAIQGGVELRSPLTDRRIVELAVRRPWWERSSGRETKVLLRRAMRGLVPEDVLAPRATRTGVTSGYSHRWVRDVLPGRLRDLMARPLLLAELGIVDPAALRTAAERYATDGDAWIRVNLFNTLQTEAWLRAHASAHLSVTAV